MSVYQIFVHIPGIGNNCISFKPGDKVSTVYDQIEKKLSEDTFIIHQGRLTGLDTVLQNEHTYHVIPRLVGGKGGFGSMLRALGAQIEKTTNREACRDLSGRRMRDVNNEQKLREWVAKASDRKREKELKKRERLERRKAEPRHQFDDPDYVRQKMQVAEGLEDALQQGLHKSTGGSSSATCTVTSSSRKRKSDEAGPSSAAKKQFEWLGDGISLSDLDSESDSELESLPADGANHDHDRHSDSGVESVSEIKTKGSPMDVDSDSSGRDSAVNSDVSAGNRSLEMQVENPVEVKADAEAEQHGAGLLAESAQCKPAEPEQIDPETVDLLNYSSVSELETLGLDVLKAILIARGMKCGGTLQQRAERTWAVRGVPHEQIHSSLLAKPQRGKGKKR